MTGVFYSHPCPVPYCRATRLRPAMLLCNLHWNMLPTDLRNRTKASWSDARPTAEYLHWRTEAVAYITEVEGRR